MEGSNLNIGDKMTLKDTVTMTGPTKRGRMPVLTRASPKQTAPAVCLRIVHDEIRR